MEVMVPSKRRRPLRIYCSCITVVVPALHFILMTNQQTGPGRYIQMVILLWVQTASLSSPTAGVFWDHLEVCMYSNIFLSAVQQPKSTTQVCRSSLSEPGTWW